MKEGKFKGKIPYWMLMISGIETNKVAPLTSTSLSYLDVLSTRLLAYKPQCASHYYRSSSFVFFAREASHPLPILRSKTRNHRVPNDGACVRFSSTKCFKNTYIAPISSCYVEEVTK